MSGAPLRITILTAGTRGSVQSVLALAQGLTSVGYRVRMCAGQNLRSYVEDHGLEYAYLDDGGMHLAPANRWHERTRRRPLEAMALILRVARGLRPSLRSMVKTAWLAAADSDAIIYRPHIVGGHLLAAKLGVPSFLVEPAPAVTPTREFPHFLLPDLRLGRGYNRLTYSIFDAMTWPLQRVLRQAVRDLPAPDPPKRPRLAVAQWPIVLNNFSPEVLPRPADWPDWAELTGWLFVPAPTDWVAPPELSRFLAAGPAPVYIGFGSMVQNAERATGAVLSVVQSSRQRFILARGWGGLEPRTTPHNAFVLDAAPHDWLFPRMAALVHHGGAGTVGNGLRAGKPNVCCPFFGDQVFWSRIVHRIGAGPEPVRQSRLSAETLGRAIDLATSDETMRSCADRLGVKLRKEDGVARAIEIIRSRLEAPEREAGGVGHAAPVLRTSSG